MLERWNDLLSLHYRFTREARSRSRWRTCPRDRRSGAPMVAWSPIGSASSARCPAKHHHPTRDHWKRGYAAGANPGDTNWSYDHADAIDDLSPVSCVYVVGCHYRTVPETRLPVDKILPLDKMQGLQWCAILEMRATLKRCQGIFRAIGACSDAGRRRGHRRSRASDFACVTNSMASF